jgi:cyanophycinase-like exopeptidase
LTDGDGDTLNVTVALRSGERKGYKFYRRSGNDDPKQANWVDKDVAGQGGVMLVGGGTTPLSADTWFGEHANGGDIVIIGNGYTQEDFEERVNERFDQFGGIGTFHAIDAFSFDVEPTDDLTQFAKDVAANRDGYGHEFLAKLRGAEAVYFLGGDQWPYVQLLQAPGLAADIISGGNNGEREHGSGSVTVGGTSAGLAILGQYVFTSEFARTGPDISSAELLENYYTSRFYQGGKPSITDNVLSLKGMGEVLTETHFTDDGKSSIVSVLRPDGIAETRNIFRLGRFLSFMGAVVADPSGLGRPIVNGLAVDNNTALCVDNEGLAKVHGTKYVYFASFEGANGNTDSGKLTIHGNVGMNWYSATPDQTFSFANAWNINPNIAHYAAYSLTEGVLQRVAGNWPDSFPAPM